MKEINIRYFALLREDAKKDQEEYRTKAKSAYDLYQELKNMYHFFLSADQVKVSVNEKFEKMDYVLQSGDRVVFIPPVAGG